MLSNPLLLGAESAGYQLLRSLRFRSAASAYLSRTFGAPNSATRYTVSFWHKRGTLGGQATIFGSALATGAREVIGFFGSASGSGDSLHFRDTSGGAYEVTTTALFRDPSAWYHIVIGYDSTLGTASDRVKMHVNGIQITSFAVASWPGSNQPSYINSAGALSIGQRGDSAQYLLDGLLADVIRVDGQVLTPSSFGQYDANGMWQPKDYVGTYGTNGFRLDFSDNTSTTTLMADRSGNGNNWTANNISLTAGATYDSMIDVPLGGGGGERGNYCTLNPLAVGAGASLAEGNLYVVTGTSQAGGPNGTIGMSSGKWYWEMTSIGAYTIHGIRREGASLDLWVGQDSLGYGYYQSTGQKTNNNVQSAYGATWTNGNVIGVAFDATAGTLEFFKNGTSQGVAFAGIPAGTYFAAHSDATSGNNTSDYYNFGQRPFTYTPPAGFKALHTGNLPAAPIGQPNKHFDVLTWTGDGVNPRNIGGLNFQPDFVDLKSRSQAYAWRNVDSVRGAANELSHSTASGEFGADPNGSITAITSNGFTLFGSTNNINVNTNGASLMAWAMKAGGAAVTNNNGSTSAQVSANAAAGISVVTYGGTSANATIGHGLGVPLKFKIVKCRTVSTDWVCWHSAFTGTEYISLNAGGGKGSSATMWNSSIPTSSVFSVGTIANDSVNASGRNYVAYCFAEIAGFSRFGSLIGNGSSDGTFVHLGFLPRFVMVKRTDTTSDWFIWDTARSPFNVISAEVYANDPALESSATVRIDAVSNGFKVRAPGASNPSVGSASYIYAAFASAPFNSALAR
jgi:hypothetical protein